MRNKLLLYATLLLLPMYAIAQDTKKVAILETVDKYNKVSYGIKLQLRSNLTYAISNTPGYEGIDRVDMSSIIGEHNFQRTGMVTRAQIKKLGEMTGAGSILVAEAAIYDASHIIITAKILNVETAGIENSAPSKVAGTDPESMERACNELAVKLLGSMNSGASAISSNSSSVSGPTIALEQLELGNDYYYGRNGKTKDYNQAVYWLRKSAEHGNAKAQFNLGFCYDDGIGVSQDHSQAVYWYRKAAEQGLEQAQFNLGLCYDDGIGVSQDHSQAVYWYRKAAEQGLEQAQFNLGLCYGDGRGVPQDHSQAVYWYGKAAEQGNADAQNNLGECYYYGRGVSQDYGQAVYWYGKAAEQGNADAQYNYGFCYEKGQGVSQSWSDAVYWYRKSADQGKADAQYNYGFCYEKGQGVSQSWSDAVYWYRKSADQGNADAQNNLGECYYFGRGVSQDYGQAVYWYGKAAEQGNAGAQYSLGWCYEKGQAVSQSRDNAVYWYRKSAELGNADATSALNRLVEQAVAEQTVESKVFDVVEEMPCFKGGSIWVADYDDKRNKIGEREVKIPGGPSGLFEWLSRSVKYPVFAEENGIQGRVIITFVVERDGSITNVNVAKSVDPSLDKEAQRVIKSMPRWIPGKQNGSRVRVKYTVPVTFRLQ